VRRAGVLLHPSSLPGSSGVGELGPAAREWLAWMDAASLSVWQMLPVNPVGPGGCPYASDSAFAGEPLLLSGDDLVDDGWLRAAERPFSPQPSGPVDWAVLPGHKAAALALAADRVAAQIDLGAFAAQRPELAEYARFRALSDDLQAPWTAWPARLRHRDPGALVAADDRLSAPIARALALQWLFESQWTRLRADAAARGVALWGDVPYFVGGSSCDVWQRPHLWRLDEDGAALAHSGVPPDAFTAEGQHWGHPLYDEAAHHTSGFSWWLSRLGHSLRAFDHVRIDHFRGIEAVWEIPAAAPDARTGKWVPGPGRPLLTALQRRFPALPFIAEDLGVITEDVAALRDAFDLPGMAILQFAFTHANDVGDHPYLPHNHRHRQVCFTGTHDNDTLLGWLHSADEATRDHVRRYLSTDDRDAPWALLRAAWRSVCETTIVPMQDLLGLDTAARMNVPGVADGNWDWRLDAGSLTLTLAARVAQEVRLSGRHVPMRYGAGGEGAQ